MPAASSSPDAPARARDMLLVLVLTLAVFAAAHGRAFTNPYAINDDARQQLYWMASFADPGLYPPNLLNDYAELYVPSGVKALYFAASPVFDPLSFSKILTGGLFAVLCLALFGLGDVLCGRRLGYFCAAMGWLMPFFLYNISGGLSRAFAAPLLALFLLARLRGRGAAMGAVLALQAACIPYVFPLCALACCLEFAWAARRRRPLPPFPRRPVHFAVLAVCALVVLAMQRAMTASGFGPLAGIADMAGRPEFGANGRLDLFPLPNPFLDLVYWPFERIGLFLDVGLWTGVASLVVLAPLLVYGARRRDWRPLAAKAGPLAFLALASLSLYLTARLMALKLFVPDRYVSYSFNLFYALGLAACLEGALGRLANRRAGAVLLLVAALAAGAWRLDGAGLYDYAEGAAVYEAVRQLPKDALVAGHPEDLDNVLTFGRRNVVASFELAHPWLVGYWRLYEPRLRDLLAAYYAKDPAVTADFAARYGVSAFVVDERRFDPAYLADKPFFAPFDALIRELAARPGQFALLQRGNFPYSEITPGVRLVDVRGDGKPGQGDDGKPAPAEAQ